MYAVNSRFDVEDLRGPFALTQTSPPTAEPLSLVLAKQHLRVDFTDDDALITAYITAARQLIEDYCGICLVRQSWAYSFQQWPQWTLDLPRAYPLLSLDSITYYDVNNALQTADSSIYQVSKTTRPARVRPVFNQVWPSLYWRMDAATVAFTSGYLQPATADASADTLTAPSHGYSNDDVVYVWNTDNDYPAGLAASTAYYVVNKTTDTVQLSATQGGSAIDITDAGTGNTFLYQKAWPQALLAAIKLLLGHLYENRQEVIVEPGRTTAVQIPMGIEALIATYRDYAF